MERIYYALNLGLWDVLAFVRTMVIFGHLICLRILWWDVLVIVRTIPTSSSSWPMDHALDLMVCFYRFLRWLWLSLWGRPYFWHDFDLHWWIGLLQWSKDFSDTTVFGWLTLTMSNRTFYSPLRLETVRCYLYLEDWFGERTLCSDHTLYPEEGCTDTLCESLRSWEVSHKFG